MFVSDGVKKTENSCKLQNKIQIYLQQTQRLYKSFTVRRMLKQGAKTMMGIILIKFAMGFMSDWGSISMYVLSYFHYYGSPIQIQSNTNSLAIVIVVIPIICCFFISTHISNIIGYIFLIRISAVMLFIFPLFSFISFNFVIFFLCNLVIPSCAFSLCFIPLFHCLYSYYNENKNLATGVVFGSFSLGAIVWNLVATLFINPDNQIPNIPSNQQSFYFFSQEIADRVPRTMNFIYLISGILAIIGAALVSRNQNYNNHEQFGIDQIEESSESYRNDKNKLEKQQQKISHLQTGEIKTRQQQQEGSSLHILKYTSYPIAMLLFALTIFVSVYQSYVQINTKIIYMQILEDDHLLSIGLMLIILSTAICSVPWGILADKKGSVTAIICFLIVDFFSKIFAAFVSNKVWYLISMVLIGATEKTMMVIFGPILVDTYGLKIATELLPLKGVSVIISMIIAACLGLVLSQYAEKSLYWLCGFNVIGVIIGVYLAIVISKHHKINKKIKYPEDGISV